jgi:hypothetical protein
VDAVQAEFARGPAPRYCGRAEEATGALPVTAYQQALLRNALEAAGVEFTNGDEPGVKLKGAR